MLGIINSNPCEAVKVVLNVPVCSAPCTAPTAPPSLCISTIDGIVSPRFRLPSDAHWSHHSAIGDDGVIGYIAITSFSRKATCAAASLPSSVLNVAALAGLTGFEALLGDSA